jgi:hypothetical protein
MSTYKQKEGRFGADRKTELRQRITSHLAMQTPAGMPRPSWKDKMTPEQIHKLVQRIRSI